METCFVCNLPRDGKPEALDQMSGHWRHEDCDPREHCTAHGNVASECPEWPCSRDRR